MRENQEEETENKPNFGTLTLRRRKEEKEVRDQKMEQLKKKIKTDDECNYPSSFIHPSIRPSVYVPSISII